MTGNTASVIGLNLTLTINILRMTIVIQEQHRQVVKNNRIHAHLSWDGTPICHMRIDRTQ